MKCFKENRKSIGFSIVWAGLILLTAYLSKDKDFASTAFIFAIGGWYITYHYLFRPNSMGCHTRHSCSVNAKFDENGEH